MCVVALVGVPGTLFDSWRHCTLGHLWSMESCSSAAENTTWEEKLKMERLSVLKSDNRL